MPDIDPIAYEWSPPRTIGKYPFFKAWYV